MNSTLLVSVLIAYFLVLVLIAYLTSRNASSETFFTGDRKSPWFLVSFGMIGASLSGVTFISIPGWVGDAGKQFSYMQAVFGYFIGYLVIAYVLLPIYYRMQLVSIYEYLQDRFGFWSYKTGASFFLLSRIIGASVRLLLVANVLQQLLFDDWGIPFELTVVISVLLIWIYTSRGGIKTIVWTDTLQTSFMLISVLLTVWFISDALDLKGSGGIVKNVMDSKYSKIFFFDDFMGGNHFFKSFFGGMFITIGMTGLDQDMMQKNLTCKNLKDAKKNMITMASILVVVNLVFLALGALLYMFADKFGIDSKGDLLFSSVAMSDYSTPAIAVFFFLGLIAAAYSSADSALTSLTTSFSVDFLNIRKKDNIQSIRRVVHIGMSIVLILVVLLLHAFTNESAIGLLMKFAGFTYGPLIGVFFFGILTKKRVQDNWVPYVSFLAIAITGFCWYYSAGAPGAVEIEGVSYGIFGRYAFGFELIVFNALITFLLMFVASFFKPQIEEDENSVA